MPTFSTSFLPPDPVTGFTIEARLLESSVHLTWDATVIPAIDFAGYRIYRSADSGASFVLLAVLADVNDVEYDDFEAPLNQSLLYRMTQSNLDFESDPVEGSTLLSDRRWWVVTPGDVSLTFPIPKVRNAPVTSPKVQEVYAPMGRPGKVAVGDVVQNEEGQLTFLMMPDNPTLAALMRSIQSRMDETIILKAPDGSIFHTQFGSMTRSFTNVPGMQEISVPFIGVT